MNETIKNPKTCAVGTLDITFRTLNRRIYKKKGSDD